MGLNNLVAELAIMELNKFKSDSSLYDAIVQRDVPLILYLVNNKYKLDVANRGYIKEPISIAKMMQAIELGLNRKKHIRLIN